MFQQILLVISKVFQVFGLQPRNFKSFSRSLFRAIFSHSRSEQFKKIYILKIQYDPRCESVQKISIFLYGTV